MKRTVFIKILLLLWTSLASAGLFAAEVSGRVCAADRPLAGVAVSDGVRVVRTGADGRFTIDLADDAPFVWAATPSGHVAPHADGTPRFYLPADGRASYDFDFIPAPGPFTLLAVGDPQPKTARHMKRLKAEVAPDWKKSVAEIRAEGGQPAMLVLGDVVWDKPELSVEIRRVFAGLDIPVYTVIGNHDHLIAEQEDAASTRNYREVFGPTYYAFELGDTHFVVLDNIVYHGGKVYEEAIDERQLDWLAEYVKLLPRGSRLCIAMHAPFQKYWRNFARMGNGDRLLEIVSDFEVHFITGHTHINSNCDVAPGAIEHNVAQVAGNLWHAPLNQDGTPRGYQLFREGPSGLEWQYKTLGEPRSYQIELYAPGRVATHPAKVVAKVWNWDPQWRVAWSEDGRPMGEMERFETLPDPDYLDHLAEAKARAEAAGKQLSKAQYARPAFFYFGAEPSAEARIVEVTATDRFGNRYTQTLNLKKEQK